jgi:hypothetical protein
LGNGFLVDSYSVSSLPANQSSAFLVRNVQTISNAAHSALDLGSVVTPGWAVFANLDTTNYVEVGIDVGGAFHPFLKLKPGQATPAVSGEQFPCRLGVAAPYAKANTAPVKLFYIIYND